MGGKETPTPPALVVFRLPAGITETAFLLQLL